MALVTLGSTSEIPNGEGKAFKIGRRCIAVFNASGSFYAIDDTCPHKGASLAKGMVSDTEVNCPLHTAVFSLIDGSGIRGLCYGGVEAYAVTVDGDTIQVEVPDYVAALDGVEADDPLSEPEEDADESDQSSFGIETIDD